MHRPHYVLSIDQSSKTNGHLKPMSDYLKKMVDRLRELKVEDTDPLLRDSMAAMEAVNRLSMTVLFAVRKPTKDDVRMPREER